MLLLSAAAVHCGSPRWRCRCSSPMGCVDYHDSTLRRGLARDALGRPSLACLTTSGGEWVERKMDAPLSLNVLDGDRGRPPPNRFCLFAVFARLPSANALGRAAATDATGWPRRVQVLASRRYAPPCLRTPRAWSSVHPLPQPLTVTAAGVFGGQLLAAAERVCLRCGAALLRDVLGGQEAAGVHKARESVKKRGVERLLKHVSRRALHAISSSPASLPFSRTLSFPFERYLLTDWMRACVKGGEVRVWGRGGSV
jgi:hypothetical protein